MFSHQQEGDWEVTREGLYIATRGYLIRRGYCCANRCRNCPYINWRNNPAWQPVPADRIRRTRVSARVIAGARAGLQHHQQQLSQCALTEQGYHQTMIQHYHLLLEYWNPVR